MGFARLPFSNATHRQNALDQYMYRILILNFFSLFSFPFYSSPIPFRTEISIRTLFCSRLFARQRPGGREGTGERETPPGSEVVDGEVVVFTALSQAVHRPAPGGALSELSGALCFLLSISLSLSLHVFASVFQRWESESGPIVRCPGRGVRLLVFRLLLVAVLADQHQAHQLCALVQRRAELVVSQGESVLNFDWSKS